MKQKMLIAVSALFLLCAVSITIYPIIANHVNDKYQSEIQTNYEQNVEILDDSAIQTARKAAQVYNESLGTVRFEKEDLASASYSYDELLNLTGSGIMGIIEIPKIGISLPIYHGTAEDVLQCGVGHLLGSSLPIGGAGCHSVLTGHSGVAGARLFSDLDQLMPGDTFFLHVLGETLAYEVTEINAVLPYETDLLIAAPGEDLCTLVTCTPYGVNSHRLLVRGLRVPNEDVAESVPEMIEEPSRSTWKEKYLQSLAIGGSVALGIVLNGIFLITLIKKQKRRHRNEN